MAWVKMTADHLKRVRRGARKSFKANCRYSVPRAWAEEFVAAGIAQALETPTRDQAPAVKPARRRRRKASTA